MSGPLLQAASQHIVERQRALLASGGDAEYRDEHGWTALHHAACGTGGIDTAADAAALIAAGVPVDATTHQGNTALHLATRRRSYNDDPRGRMGMVRALIAAGADVNCANVHGRTPLLIALCEDECGMLKTLLRAGAALNRSVLNHFFDAYASFYYFYEHHPAFDLADSIVKMGGWDEYARRRRETLVGVVGKCTRGAVPDVVVAEIAAFVSPPGGH